MLLILVGLAYKFQEHLFMIATAFGGSFAFTIGAFLGRVEGVQRVHMIVKTFGLRLVLHTKVHDRLLRSTSARDFGSKDDQLHCLYADRLVICESLVIWIVCKHLLVFWFVRCCESY